MENLVGIFESLIRLGILQAAFIFGMVFLLLAIIGKIPTGNGHTISLIARATLAALGLTLMAVSLGGALFTSTSDSPVSTPTLAAVAVTTASTLESTSTSQWVFATATNSATPTATTRPPIDNTPVRRSLPSTVTLSAGSLFSPEQSLEWGWICSGDFDLTSGSTSRPLYDNDQRTGLIVILAVGNRAQLYAQSGGVCDAYYPETRTFVETRYITNMLNSSNCEGGCSTVEVVELSADGSEVRRETKR